jgi:hypothetical protein
LPAYTSCACSSCACKLNKTVFSHIALVYVRFYPHTHHVQYSPARGVMDATGDFAPPTIDAINQCLILNGILPHTNRCRIFRRVECNMVTCTTSTVYITCILGHKSPLIRAPSPTPLFSHMITKTSGICAFKSTPYSPFYARFYSTLCLLIQDKIFYNCLFMSVKGRFSGIVYLV